MANTYITRQEVLDAYNAAFQVKVFFLDYANTVLVDRESSYSLSQFGNGITVQVRRRPTTKGQVIDITGLTGPFVKTNSFVEQETINVNVDQFFYAQFELNAVNQTLFLNGRAADDETVLAAVDNQSFTVNKYIYDNLLQEANILALSPSTPLSNQTTLGKINVVANANNMPEKRCMMLSNTAGNDLQAHFGTYLNPVASTPALKNRIFGANYFDEIASDNVVTKLETGTAYLDNGSVTLNAAAVNGDTTLDIISASATPRTIKVNDPLTFTADDTVAVARSTFQNIPTEVIRPSFIVAAPTGANPAFDIGTQTYTLPANPGVITIAIAQPVQTTGNFQTISTPTDTLIMGSPISFYAPHVVSFMVADSGINFASPKITPIDNATNTYSSFNDLNMRFATQGDLNKETNLKELASLYGSGYDRAYLVRVMSSN